MPVRVQASRETDTKPLRAEGCTYLGRQIAIPLCSRIRIVLSQALSCSSLHTRVRLQPSVAYRRQLQILGIISSWSCACFECWDVAVGSTNVFSGLVARKVPSGGACNPHVPYLDTETQTCAVVPAC